MLICKWCKGWLDYVGGGRYRCCNCKRVQP